MKQWVMTPRGVEHVGGLAEDVRARLADIDAAVARADFPVVVTLARDVGPQIDDLARPAYGSNVAEAAKLAGASQQATHAAWASNGALDDANKRGDLVSAKKAATQVASSLHIALERAEGALSALKGGGFPWGMAVGIGAASLALGLGVMWARARARALEPPPRTTWLPPEPI